MSRAYSSWVRSGFVAMRQWSSNPSDGGRPVAGRFVS